MPSFSIQTGKRREAEALFSYPNEGHEQDSLEATVAHYMRDSLQREAAGISNVTVSVSPVGGSVTFDHPDAAVGNLIVRRYGSFFSLGKKGLALAQAFQKTGKWNPKWKFLLPLGLPLEFGDAVEIMDFPPLSLGRVIS